MISIHDLDAKLIDLTSGYFESMKTKSSQILIPILTQSLNCLVYFNLKKSMF